MDRGDLQWTCQRNANASLRIVAVEKVLGEDGAKARQRESPLLSCARGKRLTESDI